MIRLKTRAFDLQHRFVIALDGPSASGKGLIGKMLAQFFSLQYFQSSLLYRGLAWMCINAGIDPENKLEVIKLLSTDPDILLVTAKADLSDEYVGEYASKIATIPEVRTELNKYQIKLIADIPRIIMEGRDIATVIAPKADLKIFLTADVAIRAERRYKQLQLEGKKYILDEIRHQLITRDLRDQERNIAPLTQTADALVIDTSNLMPDVVIAKIEEFILTR
ncbi:(d)CMP kinase [Candidatus Trichorickettsia mobilis]|uniref:(d)CMP kinase n=1 Tax=Candidatus Trichorickettsia mobilis TaxID=1346319 RepID=UPI00292F4677|nr:(d)CMP kinase [Candidatus Trichorickettsia mobilis]